MFLEKVRSQGLAHLSYILGDGEEAAVIDPRRDCWVYLEIAHRQGARITHVFETHRNEDYVIGSKEIARRTGATIHHGHALDFAYGEPVQEGDVFELGAIRLRVLETPGHTDESISLALSDAAYGDEPAAVFTGDALFSGDVGRTDFFPDRAEEVAGLLYDSIFNKLLPLGDQALLYPAHGAGSVCGSGMASREFTSLGYERRNNPSLQMDRDAFVQYKVNENHYQPPYFRKMEEFNLKGNAPVLDELPKPAPMSPSAFEAAMEDGMLALDVRSPEANAGALVPGSLAIPLNMLPAFAGWYVDYDRPIGLIVRYEQYDHAEEAVRMLARLGYDNIAGFLDEGLHGWETSGKRYDRIGTLHAAELTAWITSGKDFTLLDVRSIDEYESGHLQGARHIYAGKLPDHVDELPRGKPVVTFCGSGRRAVIAASVLKQHGFEEVYDCLGSMSACSTVGCPLEGAA